MGPELLTVFDRLQGMAAIGTLELKGSRYVLAVDEGLATDLAFELSTAPRIIVEVLMRSCTKWAYGIFRNGAGLTVLGFDWFNGFAVTEPVVLIPELPVLFDERPNDRQLIGEEFLVFWAEYVIVGPLLKRDVSADKENKPTNLSVLFLNDSK